MMGFIRDLPTFDPGDRTKATEMPSVLQRALSFRSSVLSRV